MLSCTLDGLHHVGMLKVAKAIARHDGDVGLGYPARLNTAENLADFFRLVLVVCAHMAAKLVQSVKVLAANLADVRATDIVDATMLGEVGGFTKLFATNVTLQRLGTSMSTLVHCQGTLLLKGLVAALERANPWLLASVRAHMLLKRLLGRQRCAANMTLYRFI